MEAEEIDRNGALLIAYYVMIFFLHKIILLVVFIHLKVISFENDLFELLISINYWLPFHDSIFKITS